MTHWIGVVSNCTVWTVFWTLSLFLLVLSKLLRQHSEFVLVSSPTVQLDIKGAFHFPRNSANSGWDANGTHVFQAFQWKVARNKWNFEKIVLFPVGNFPVEMHGPFTSFHKESPVPGYAGLNLSRQLEFW